MTNRETMQQALKCIERCNKHGWILADFEDEVYAAIAALREVLAQPERRKPLTDEEIRRIKPVSPDLVDFRSGVRCAEAAHGIKE